VAGRAVKQRNSVPRRARGAPNKPTWPPGGSAAASGRPLAQIGLDGASAGRNAASVDPARLPCAQELAAGHAEAVSTAAQDAGHGCAVRHAFDVTVEAASGLPAGDAGAAARFIRYLFPGAAEAPTLSQQGLALKTSMQVASGLGPAGTVYMPWAAPKQPLAGLNRF